MAVPMLRACWRWIRATWWPNLLFLGVLFAIAWTAERNYRAAVLALAVALLAAAGVLGSATRRARKARDYPVGQARVNVAIAGLVIGAPLVGWSMRGGSDPVGFVALGLVIISGGALVSEARQAQTGPLVRGPRAVWFGFFGAVIAIVYIHPGRLMLATIVAAAAFAELGTELRSESKLRDAFYDPKPGFRLGVALMLASVALLIGGGAGIGAALLIASVIVVLVWMAASDSDSLVLVVIVAAAVIWSSAPHGDTTADAIVPAANDKYFLALGDSYISGEGASHFYDGTNTVKKRRANQCRRAPTAWPVRLANEPPAGRPGKAVFIACSGAQSADIDGQLAQFAAMRQGGARLEGTAPEFAVISIGGNDAGFGKIGKSCVAPGDCSELGDEFLDVLRTVQTKIEAAHAAVRKAVGNNVPVIAVPYPIPITETGHCGVLLSENERKFVVPFVQQLNRVVESAAVRGGLYYLDTMPTSVNRLCGSSAAEVNFLRWNPVGGSLWDNVKPTNWIHDSLHPNEHGHAHMYTSAKEWFDAHEELPALARPNPKPAPYAVPSMATQFTFGAIKLCDPSAGSCDVDHLGWLFDQSIRLAVTVFLPIVMAMIGAWLVIMRPIFWAARKNVSSADVLKRILLGLGWIS